MAKIQYKSNVRNKVRWGIVGILALLLVAGFFDAPGYTNKVIDKINNTIALGLPRVPDKTFRLGLDLEGGANLIYQADVSGISAADSGGAVEGVRDVIERRVNGLGVSEPIVQTAKVGDDYRIIVELPGITDVNEAIKIIGGTPILEFKEENTVPPRELTPEEQSQLKEYNDNAKKKALEILKKVKAGENFETIAKENSEDDKSKNNGGYLEYLAPNLSDPDLYAWAESHKEGDISVEPIENFEGYNVLKRGKEQEGETLASASHILICYLGAEACSDPKMSKEEAYSKAQELFNQANANNFADLAKENSTDLGSKDSGGALGEFGKDAALVQSFKDAVFGAEAGQIIGPVETQFGYHIIYKTAERITKKYELWRVLISTQSEADILPPQDPWMNTGLSGSQLKKAEVVTNQQTGEIQVSLKFNGEGTELFKQITERNLRKPVAIFLDGEIISAPNVQTIISDGEAVITGGFDLAQAKLLAQRLNAGALPVPVQLISQQSVGATLGAESLAKSLKAGVIGTLLVMLFMLLYYRLPGLLSVFALCLYVALTLAVFKLVGVTLSLAGIAGMILSIGMAVDANILIFERMKEELQSGKSLRASLEEGFVRAWTSIRDSNSSTLISCVLLIWFGTGFVKGFAVTLIIGVLISLFSAITVTRVLLRFIVPWFGEKGNILFLGYKKILEGDAVGLNGSKK